MKKRMILTTIFIVLISVWPVLAMQGHGSKASSGGHDMKAEKKMDHDSHGDTHSASGGSFKHHASSEGVDAAFEVMSLASMNMKSDKGETHHIMVNLKAADSGAPIKNAVGKIKVVGPNGEEQVNSLQNYNGILAANFTFKEKGKYGVICLIKNGDNKRVFKFWYHHM